MQIFVETNGGDDQTRIDGVDVLGTQAGCAQLYGFSFMNIVLSCQLGPRARETSAGSVLQKKRKHKALRTQTVPL